MGLMFEQSESVSEGERVEKPKDERAPVQRLLGVTQRREVFVEIFFN